MPLNAPNPAAANNPLTGGWGGGYVYPSVGAAGFIQSPQGIPYYTGVSKVGNIPDFERTYSMRDELIFLIQEGRNNMMKVLFEYARRNPVEPKTDVQFRTKVKHQGIPRIYIKKGTTQFPAQTANALSKMYVRDLQDVKKLQSGDLIASMGTFVDVSRANKPVIAKSVSAPVPELIKIYEVNYSTGELTVERNWAATIGRTNPGADAFEVSDTAGAGKVVSTNAFFVKMGNSIPEGLDDQRTYSKSFTWDYNFLQQTIRKWSWNDIESNVKKAGDNTPTATKNKLDTLEDFYDQLEWAALFGTAGEGQDSEGRWFGHAGGFFEHVPSANYHSIYAPVYNTGSNTATTMGDFTVPKFNKLFENKFYYGSQDKILLCGVDFHTAFSVMMNNMTTAIAAQITSWSVMGHSFKPSNGGNLTVIPSDKMSLNGMSDTAILLDPETFRYTHLQNRDIDVIEQLDSENPHESSGEIGGVYGFERHNPEANHVFIMG